MAEQLPFQPPSKAYTEQITDKEGNQRTRTHDFEPMKRDAPEMRQHIVEHEPVKRAGADHEPHSATMLPKAYTEQITDKEGNQRTRTHDFEPVKRDAPEMRQRIVDHEPVKRAGEPPATAGPDDVDRFNQSVDQVNEAMEIMEKAQADPSGIA